MKCDICGKEVLMTDSFTGYQINFCSQCQMQKLFSYIVPKISYQFNFDRQKYIKDIINLSVGNDTK